MIYYVYILRCKDDSLYTGYARDLDKRIKTHNMKAGAKYTRSRLPVRLVFYKKFDSKSLAMQVEARIKSLTKAKKEALVKSFALRK